MLSYVYTVNEIPVLSSLNYNYMPSTLPGTIHRLFQHRTTHTPEKELNL